MDRFFRGLMSGMIGGLVMNAWSFISYHILHFTKLRYVDWTAVITYGYLPQNLTQVLYALFVHLLWVGFLGVVFAYIIPETTSRIYWLKGGIFGYIFGFIFYAIPTLFQTPHLNVTPFTTVISNHIGGFIWGVVTAMTLHWLNETQSKNLMGS